MKYYLDYNTGLILKNLNEERFQCSYDFSDAGQKYLILNDDQVEYYNNNPFASSYDIWNMTQKEDVEIIQELPIDDSEMYRIQTIENIKNYDKSSAVNSFIINKDYAWIDRDTRVSLMNTANIRKQNNHNEMVLWLDNISYTLTCDKLIQMLMELEEYAFECYNVTQQHISKVNELTWDELINYDYKSNYPEKINFNIYE